jgi:hypothetical protein
LGGIIGAVGGLVLHEVDKLYDPDFVCNERDPGCTQDRYTKLGPVKIRSRAQHVLIFGGIGVVIGFAIGG